MTQVIIYLAGVATGAAIMSVASSFSATKKSEGYAGVVASLAQDIFQGWCPKEEYPAQRIESLAQACETLRKVSCSAEDAGQNEDGLCMGCRAPVYATERGGA